MILIFLFLTYFTRYNRQSLTSAQTLSPASSSVSASLVSSDGLQVLHRQKVQLQSAESGQGPTPQHAAHIVHNGSCWGLDT